MRLTQAKVEEQHELLEIGCGWGGFATEVVKKTGCRYTGITLAEEQLKYAERRVREAGLQVPLSFTSLLRTYVPLISLFYFFSDNNLIRIVWTCSVDLMFCYFVCFFNSSQ